MCTRTAHARVLLFVGAITAATLGAFASHCSPFGAVAQNDAGGDPTDGSSSSLSDAASDAGDTSCVTDVMLLATDARNCGRCGHDCEKGACAKGRCLPYPINDVTPGESGGVPWYVAVDETHAYWTSYISADSNGDGKVRSAPKHGGPTKIIAHAPQSFDVMATQDRVVFSALSDPSRGLHYVPKEGGVITTSFDGDALDITSLEGRLFVTGRSGGATGISQVDVSSMVRAQQFNPQSAIGAAEGVAVDASWIYWTNHGSSGSLNRMDRSGNNASVLAPNEDGARRLLSDDAALYWTSSAMNRGVLRLVKETSQPKQILEARMRFGSIALDGPHLYAAAENEGQILRVNKLDGTDRVVVAEGFGKPTGIAVDKDAIYFTDRTKPEIWRVRK